MKAKIDQNYIKENPKGSSLEPQELPYFALLTVAVLGNEFLRPRVLFLFGATNGKVLLFCCKRGQRVSFSFPKSTGRGAKCRFVGQTPRYPPNPRNCSKGKKPFFTRKGSFGGTPTKPRLLGNSEKRKDTLIFST